jgi:hypothetical protein
MKSDALALTQIAVTLIGMFVGPWLAVKSSLKQFKSQRWHERQGEFYEQILENLAIVTHVVGALLEHELHPDYALGPTAIVRDQLAPAAAKLAAMAAIGPYYISDSASRALNRFVGGWGIDTGCGLTDEYERNLRDATSALGIIRSEAQRNLGRVG